MLTVIRLRVSSGGAQKSKKVVVVPLSIHLVRVEVFQHLEIQYFRWQAQEVEEDSAARRLIIHSAAPGAQLR